MGGFIPVEGSLFCSVLFLSLFNSWWESLLKECNSELFCAGCFFCLVDVFYFFYAS